MADELTVAEATPTPAPPPMPLVSRDDATDDFLNTRQALSADDVINRWRGRLATPSTEDGKAAATARPAVPSTREGTPDKEGAKPASIEVRPFPTGGFGAYSNGNIVAGGASAEDALSAGRQAIATVEGEGSVGTARTVLRGVANTASQLPRGMILGAAEMFRAADDLGDWLQEKLPLPGGPDAPGSPDTPGRTLAADLDKLALMFPAPKGGMQAATQEVSKWLLGFWRGAQALGGIGAGAQGVAKAAGAGAIADFFTQQPHQDRLADLWRKMDLPENVLTDYLADDTGDSEIEGRFKNALEGVVAGGLVDGVMMAVRGIRTAMKTKKADKAVEVDPLAADREKYGEVTDRDFMLLGDPNKPLFELTKAPQPEALAVNQRAGKVTKEGMDAAQRVDPSDIVSRAKAALNFSARTLDDIGAEDAAMRTDDTGLSELLAVVRGKVPAGAKKQKSLTQFLVGMGGLKEVRGEVKAATGGAKARPGLINNKGGVNLDDATLKAWQEGYFPEFQTRPEINDLLEALGEDISGRSVRLGNSAADADQAIVDAAADLDRLLNELGIDPKKATDAEIANSLRGLSEEVEPRSLNAIDRESKELADAGYFDQAMDSKVYVNFAKINTPDDIKAVMGQMADAFAGKIDKARRGVQSNEETVKLADDLGMTVPDLMARRKGQPFNAEEAVAARQLWASSAEKLLEAARMAAAPNAGAIDQYNFRKMMAVHYAVQAEVIGARTETARALQSWSIPAGGSVEKARGIQQLIDGMGGPEASVQMAKRLAILAEQGNAAGLSQFVRKGWGATSVDAVREVWINALLSSPKTHIVNTASNMLIAFQQIYERKAGEAISAMRGGDDGVAPGEAAALAYGMIGAVPDAFRMFWKAVKSGETGSSLGKVDLPMEPAVSGEAFRIQNDAASRFVDFLGTTFRIPSRLLGAEDEFFKTIGYRMNMRAEALRMAFSEGHRDKALADRVAEIVADPPEHLKISAADAALYQTFTQKPGKLGVGLMTFREKVPLTSFVLPFIRTPVNIAGYAFERSPFAPLNARWRDDIAAGGARRDLALARLGTGTMIMLYGADLADSGLVTGWGPDDAGEREALTRQGWQPYSVKVGERWYSYNRTEPFGMTIGFAADMAELVRRSEIEADEIDEVNEILGAIISSSAHTVLSKTYMEGISEFVEMLSDSERYATGYISQFMGSFVPAGMAALESAMDPTVRDTNAFSDYITSRIAGLSASLPARRNLWGEAMKPESGFGTTYDALSPVAVRQIKVSPADKEIERLNLDIRRISKKTNWDGVAVNLRDWPKVYERYVTLAGNELKHPAWNLGMKDFIDAVASGKHDLSEVYRILPDTDNPVDGGKAAWFHARVQEYRRLARQAIMEDPEFSDFAEAVGASKQEKIEKRMPNTGSLTVQ